MSRSMTPLQRWRAPGRCPARHSSPSRTSIVTMGSRLTRMRSTSATVTSRIRRLASATRRRKPGECSIARLVLLAALAPDEAVRRFGEQDVERGQAPVGARDVVLQLDAVLVGQLRVRVDPLLEHAEPLANRDDLPEEHVDRDGLL